MAETDAPKNSMILAMVIGTVGALIFVVLALAQFFNMAVRDEIQDKVLAQPSSALRELHAREAADLSRYAWVDQKKGIVRIPVDRAVELTLRDWPQRPQGLVKVEDTAPAAASAPASAPAPAAASAPASAPASASAPAASAPAPKPGTP
jgi:hypothetical protein